MQRVLASRGVLCRSFAGFVPRPIRLRTMRSMSARSIGSGTISFGMLLIPVKIYTAVSPKSVGFNQLHKACGSRLKQQLVCLQENVVVEYKDTIKGYEYAKDEYVKFTPEEIKELETKRTGAMPIEHFVASDAVDLTQIEKSYFLGPDKGGDRAYALLAQALHRNDRLAVARHAARGKDYLVLIRAIAGGKGLVMHQCYYANEVHSFDEVDIGGEFLFKDGERELADRLVEQLEQPSFDPSRHHDTWAETVVAAVQRKIAGEELIVAPAAPTPAVVDLLEALKMSVAANENARVPVKAKGGPKKAEQREQPAAKKKRSNNKGA